MQKDPKRVDPHAAREDVLAWAVHLPRSDDYVGDTGFQTVLGNDLLLPNLRKAISFAPELWMLLERARLIELPPQRLPRVAVNRERTNIDESAQGLPAEAGLEKIARCDNRVHKRVRERLFAGARGEMKDHPGILRGGLTVIARKKIAGRVYELDRKSTRLNSSHLGISYAVFC